MEFVALSAGVVALYLLTETTSDSTDKNKKGAKAPGKDPAEPPAPPKVSTSPFKSLYPPSNDPTQLPNPDTGNGTNPNFPPICYMLSEVNQGTADAWGVGIMPFEQCKKYAVTATGPTPAWSGMMVGGKLKGDWINKSACTGQKMASGAAACDMSLFPPPPTK